MDGKGNVIARPFKKFFNYEELKEIPNESFKVYEKWGGSLGILYWIGDTPYLATRGSFTSDQAIKGTEMLQKYAMYFDEIDRSKTYLFEIVYPSNRIVVDYGDWEDIILLAVVDTTTGKDEDLYKYCGGFPFVSTLDGITDLSKIKAQQVENKEGFVILFESGIRVKIKFEEYVRLHRLLTECTARRLWEVLKEGQSLDTFLEKVPDEFYQWVRDTEHKIKEEYQEIDMAAREVYKRVVKMPTRKEQALFLMEYGCRSIVFNMLDGKDYSETIWKLIRPEHELPFKKEI